MKEEKKQGILSHLQELRKRVLWSVVGIVLTTFIAFFFADEIIELLKAPAGDRQFIFIDVVEGFATYMRVCFTVGIIGAMPFIMYNFLMFIVPALNSREKRLVYLVLPWILLMFFLGVFFAYMFLVPPATQFLLGFGADVAEVQPRLGNYVNFVIRLILVIGLVFEMPVVIAFLARIGIVTWRWLAGKRKIVIVLAFILAAVITPTPDAINQSIVAGTLIVLYEFSIWLAWLIGKRHKEPAL